MGSRTTNLSLYKPDERERGWADEMNANLDTLDEISILQADEVFWDNTNKRLGIRTAAPARTVDIAQTVVGTPQVRLSGAENNEYTELRCGGSGGNPNGDGGDLFVQPTGSTVWMQTLTADFPTTLELVPKGTQATNAANLELYGTDYLNNASNFSRLRFSANGSAGDAHEIISDQGGSVPALPIHIYIGGIANGLYLQTDGTNGIGTLTPRRKLDILDTATQLRLSYTDNTVFWDFDVDSGGQLELTPSDVNAEFRVNAKSQFVGAFKIEVIDTGNVPGADAQYDGRILIENVDANTCKLVVYKGGKRFKATLTES